MDESKNFTRLLVEKNLITAAQLQQALELHAQKGGSFSELLVNLKFIDEKDLMMFLSTYLAIPPIKVLNLKLTQSVLSLIPKDTAKKYMVLPVGKLGSIITVAVADPLNMMIFDDLEHLTGCQISPVIASRSELQQAFDVHYKESFTSAIEEIIKDDASASIEIIQEEKDDVKDDEILRTIEEAPIIKLTNYIIKKAVEEKASDVLIEPLGASARVRYRIDGVLREAQSFPKKMHSFVISRIKVIANLNITEHRLPQDGRFRMSIGGCDIDFRVSILPATMGEKAVLRILDKSAGLLDLAVLGFEKDIEDKIKKDAETSFGMFLVCGPTGSGKTTSLYSVLRHVYSPEKNVITVEDPIEYQLEGINQVNVNYDVKLTFASALRSILRQDPDVIMVGEIRDFDTVDIAIKAALTGHLVLSTLHTTTAAGSVTRLINMGVEPFLLSSTVIGILAQRLARKLCPQCRQSYQLDEPACAAYGFPAGTVLYKQTGCKACRNFGYKGRLAVAEYLNFDASIRKLVNDAVDEHTIKRQARAQGMRTLREDGTSKVLRGLTTLEEVLRSTAADENI